MKALPRRTFLRGMGTMMALPLLDAMVPALSWASSATAAARSQGSAPRRLAFVYVPNGIHMPDWTPAQFGTEFDLPSTLQPLAAHQKDFLVLTGLTHNNGRALGDGPGDHARAAASFLTGVHPKKTDGADIRNGVSIDQIAAQTIGGKTRLSSLEMGIELGGQAGNCDSGYSCAYTNNISWRSETAPMPPEVNPRQVFERLFGGLDLSGDPESRARRAQYSKSILDFVQEDTRSLMTHLGPTDRRKLDEYLYSVREIEKRIESSEKTASTLPPSMDRPAGIPSEFQDHVRLMMDLMALAFQTDSTRVSTLMMAREGSGRAYREIGISDAHHPLTHHQNDPVKIAAVAKINRFHVEQFAYFLERLKSIKEGNGTLLDNLMLVYGSGLSDGNRHTHHDLPVLLAGRGAGSLHPGKHLQYAKETPMTNLFLSLLDRMDVDVEKFGDSNGKLGELTNI
jgi:hypothetical protein